MRIFGTTDSFKFKYYVKEPGRFLGSNDLLKGTKKTTFCYSYSLFVNTFYSKTVEPKLYLHIPKNSWTIFTGKLREYCLPWRWKTAYLDQDDESQLQKILVCTAVKEGKLSTHLSKLLGQSWLVTNLINWKCYDEIFGKEFLRIKTENDPYSNTNTIVHPWGKMVGVHVEINADSLCHIYRSRSVFSAARYELLKRFSTSWKEVTIKVASVSEKILIKKSDEDTIRSLAGISIVGSSL